MTFFLLKKRRSHRLRRLSFYKDSDLTGELEDDVRDKRGADPCAYKGDERGADDCETLLLEGVEILTD